MLAATFLNFCLFLISETVFYARFFRQSIFISFKRFFDFTDFFLALSVKRQ
jgi:hypothetical protein